MNRLGLARWIASPDNPLTARVWVNRAWEHFFGVGLVKTTENFGVQAAFPSHPALLDWLAREFVKPSQGVQVNGQPAKAWDMKAFHKLLVMSSAYRQDAKPRTDTYAADPDNRLLSRGPRFRWAASSCATGRCLPAACWWNTSEVPAYGRTCRWGSGTRPRATGICAITKTPPMTAFIGARCTRFGNEQPRHLRCCSLMRPTVVCTIQRSRTNTPLQALSLLNEVTFVEAARRLGSRMLEDADSMGAVDARLSLGRFPKATSTELAVLRDGLKEDLAYFTTRHQETVAVGESAG